ncbi:hypothetical protein [Streptomyces sp. NPDC057748]|uniref:hypothetical protein n=1 Tax=Streptomyces sp. NPDC057748 TaxID=3346239 RepID=UPI0036AA139F
MLARQAAGRPSQYLYATPHARLKHEGANHAAVDIDCFDTPGTKFALVYDAGANPWRTSRIVRTTGTNTWKTAHFYIPDGAFTGGAVRPGHAHRHLGPGHGIQRDTGLFRPLRIRTLPGRHR